MIDVILLRIMQNKKDYQILSPMVHLDALDAETSALVTDIGRYFEGFPSHEKIDLTTFMTRFPGWHKGITDEKVREYARIMANACKQEADDDQKAYILQEIADQDVAIRLANIVAEYREGEVDDLMGTLSEQMDKYRRSRGIKQIKFIETPIRELLKQDTNNEGVSWRLNTLNSTMRRLRPGDFGIIAARPDKGKTSFIASEVSHMAPQLPADKNVLWLNNEGLGTRIIPRVWQATLNLTIPEMVALDREDKLEEQYLKLMKRFDKVRIVDIHGLNNSQVELIIEQNNPGIIVYDMIDNISGFGEAARTDLALEKMYQWARERSVKYETIGLATSQISNDGDGLRYPTMSMLKDSKTGKQGACDFQIMIGAVEDKNMQTSRFMGIPKNKLRLPTGPSTPDDGEVRFDAARSRFIDLNYTDTGVKD
ncbi:putative DNA helicase DnaB-like protein [Rhizobium phage RHph_N37]|uniref:Putative DNA helicase DnaB-like protein n=1 Tax=Rhizobium phage RHph_N37 TaxID=2509749 RepID=A0A7S5RE70_9CAUD|nr:putative DNA helicase DnaB-like protein [Rhizobium phage RHph_N37]